MTEISTKDWYYIVDGSKWFMSKFAANRNYCEMTKYSDRTKVLGMRITEIEQFFTTEKPKLYKDSDLVPNPK